MFTQTEYLQQAWEKLETKLAERFGKKPDLETTLFLIGLQESGFEPRLFSKEEKQDLMHIAVCTILTPSGYFVFEKKDKDNWPHYKQIKDLPDYKLAEQEIFLKEHILRYFEKNEF